MNFIALKMLVGDRAKYLGILMGLTFASLLLTQQSGIFVGLMSRTFGFLTDTSLPDIWVMDEKVQFVDDVKPLRDTDLDRLRSVEGVEWAVPLYKGLLRARLDNGNFQSCNVLGLDDATLIGGPPIMAKGTLADLRRSDGVIVDEVGAADNLAKVLPGGRRVPLQVGDTLECRCRPRRGLE
ncbi:ABC transporter permease component (fragment) [Verrucomicrobia bacterium]